VDAIPKSQAGERLPNTVRRDATLIALMTAAFWLWLAVWLAGFAPAVMTPDSIDEWLQTIDGHYRNESPFLHTLTLAFTRKLWDSPSTIILLQITLLALAFGLSLRSLSRGKPSRLLWLAYAALFFAFPIFGAYAVTIWKDVLFSIGLFLFAIMWIDKPFMIRSIGGKWQWACAVGVLLAYVACLRHNVSSLSF
jgi:hypothetical protein